MTKKHAVDALMSWLGSRPDLKAAVDDVKVDPGGGMRVFHIVKLSPHGYNAATVCFEALPLLTTAVDGWYEVMKRKCAGKLAVDQFSEAGIGPCDSVEELVFRLEVCK